MVVRLVSRGLGGRPVRTALATLGVAASALVVFVLLGAYRSLTAGVEAYVGQPGIDVWAAPHGSDNLVRSSGFLLASAVDDLRRLPEVEAADAVLRAFVTVERGERRATLLAIGYRTPSGLAGPPELWRGRPARGDGEVMLDRAAAHRLSADLRDRVTVNGREVAVVGLTRRTNLLATQLLFADRSAAEAAGGVRGLASFVAIRLSPAALSDVSAACRRIQAAVPDVVAYPAPAFVASSLREVSAGFVPLLTLVTVLGASGASLVVALLVNALVEDRRPQIAILLAMGAPASGVAGAAGARAMALVASGSALGALSCFALTFALDRISPAVELTLRASDLLALAALFLAAGLLSALGPILRLVRVDPLLAFRP